MVGKPFTSLENADSRVSLNTMLLAQVGFVDTVDLGNLDVLFFECGGSKLVFGSKGFAVATPSGDASIQHNQVGFWCTYHGAKNSTSIKGSASTIDLKLAGVKSRTSEVPSALATQTRARAVSEERIDETLIMVGSGGGSGTRWLKETVTGRQQLLYTALHKLQARGHSTCSKQIGYVEL